MRIASEDQKRATGRKLNQIMKSFERGGRGFRGGRGRGRGGGGFPPRGRSQEQGSENLLSNIMTAQQTMHHTRGGGVAPTQRVNPLTTKFTSSLSYCDSEALWPKLQPVSGNFERVLVQSNLFCLI